jgi:hypothetical protein
VPDLPQHGQGTISVEAISKILVGHDDHSNKQNGLCDTLEHCACPGKQMTERGGDNPF